MDKTEKKAMMDLLDIMNLNMKSMASRLKNVEVICQQQAERIQKLEFEININDKRKN